MASLHVWKHVCNTSDGQRVHVLKIAYWTTQSTFIPFSYLSWFGDVEGLIQIIDVRSGDIKKELHGIS